MQKKQKRNPLALLLSAALIAAMPVMTVGCGEEGESSSSAVVSEQSAYEVKGEGENEFTFTVVDTEGTETGFEIHTDKKIVGEALVDLGLISGEDGEFGLYVKTVNGITLDFDTDGKYWAFYVNDEYAMSGVDTTEIEENAVYTFKAE